MKTLSLFTSVFLLLGCARNSYTSKIAGDNCIKQYDSKLKKNIYSSADQIPEFPGGMVELMKYITKNRSLTDESATQGTIKFEIVIDVDGAVLDERIPGKMPNTYTSSDKELLRVIRSMPRWKPGQCKKRKVPVRVPIRFYTHLSY